MNIALQRLFKTFDGNFGDIRAWGSENSSEVAS
jgi:hypothetical protein